MERHDHVRAVAHEQSRTELDASLLKLLQFADQRDGIHDNAVADDALLVRVQNARRCEMEYIAVLAHLDGVTRIVAALVADNPVHFLREDINDLPLPLVSPLSPNQNGIWHPTASLSTTS